MQAIYQLSSSASTVLEAKIGVVKSMPLWTDSLMRVLCGIVKTAWTTIVAKTVPGSF